MARHSSHPPKFVGSMAKPKDRLIFSKALTLMEEESHGAILTTHDFADADGIGTLYALQSFIKKHSSLETTIAISNAATSAMGLIEELGIRTVSWRDIPASDMRPLVIVDTSTPALLDGINGRANPIVLNIDHHKQNGRIIESRFRIINDGAVSASEVLASLIPVKKIDPHMAIALAVGIAGDSERLKYADSHSLSIFDRLLMLSGANKMHIDDLAYPALDPRTVLTIMEEFRCGMLHSEEYRGRSIAIAMTYLSMPAIMADALRDQQFSVSSALKPVNDDEYKLSIRVLFREAFRNGIHAYEIARAVGQRYGAVSETGGGHIDKGGAFLKGRLDLIVDALVQAIRKVIDSGSD